MGRKPLDGATNPTDTPPRPTFPSLPLALKTPKPRISV